MPKAKARGKLLTLRPQTQHCEAESAIGFGILRAKSLTSSPFNRDRRGEAGPKATRQCRCRYHCVLGEFALANTCQGYRKAQRAVLEASYRVNLKKIHHRWREAGLKVPLHKPKSSVTELPWESITQSMPMGPGQWIFSSIRPKMARPSSYSTLSTSTLASTWQRSWIAQSMPQGSYRLSMGSWPNTASRSTSEWTMDLQFISHALEDWAKKMGVTLYCIDPGSPFQEREV